MLHGSGLSLEALEEKVSKAIESSLVEEAVVTTYDQLTRKGRKEGLQEGEERGFRKGPAEASHESAVDVTKLLFKPPSSDDGVSTCR